MDYEYTLVERDGPVTIVTINRPEVMNALTPACSAELSGVFDAFLADPDQWVAIITGAGDRAFSAGNDLKATASSTGGIGKPKNPGGGFGGITGRFNVAKPLIAAVNGVAMGGGFEIALACDIIVAAENAIFALPESRVGLAALAGGLLRLPRAIGEKRAMEMILTSRRVTAQEGKDLGFVAEVAPKGGALDAARRIARTICEASPMSIRASKETVLRGLDMELPAAMDGQWEFPAMQAMFVSQDVKEGPAAFAEKRAPKWTGR